MKQFSLFSLTLFTVPLLAASRQATCEPSQTASCYEDNCHLTHCMGPSNFASNPPVTPYTCNGDIEIQVAGLFWTAHQDGMEYAVKTNAPPPTNNENIPLIDAEYLHPHFDWKFGYQLGIGYNSSCDGWDFSLVWTRYDGEASSHNQAEIDNNTSLLVIWSQELNTLSEKIALDIKSLWKLKLNLIDLDLGRLSWNSRMLSLRPHIGIRIAFLDQKYNLEHKGGVNSFTPSFLDLNNQVDMGNDYKGAGVRLGLDSLWHLGCGFSIYGDFALSALAGRFHISQKESNREVESPFTKEETMQVKDTVHVNTLAGDLGLGIEYRTLICDCEYGLAVSLGYEQHLFLDQNQLWRIETIGATTADPASINSFTQRRGDLSTQGWTLKVVFDF